MYNKRVFLYCMVLCLLMHVTMSILIYLCQYQYTNVNISMTIYVSISIIINRCPNINVSMSCLQVGDVYSGGGAGIAQCRTQYSPLQHGTMLYWWTIRAYTSIESTYILLSIWQRYDLHFEYKKYIEVEVGRGKLFVTV